MRSMDEILANAKPEHDTVRQQAGQRLRPADHVRLLHRKFAATDVALPKHESTMDADDLQDEDGESTVYIAEFSQIGLKSEQLSLEAPLFSLEKKDLKTWNWLSSDGRTRLEVTCGPHGRATMHDKEILIYCVSQIMVGLNTGARPSRTLRFGARAFLKSTRRGTRGDDYVRLRDALKRLKGTLITVEIEGKNTRSARQVGFIDAWEVLERGEFHKVVTVQITLSLWFFNQVTKQNVLTIDSNYFSLSPLERRLYEIARKHVGSQAQWQISIEQLRAKTGSRVARLRKFEEKVREIIDADSLPDYRLALLENGLVKFYQKDQKKYAQSSLKTYCPVDK